MERQYGAKVLVYLAYQNPDKSVRYVALVDSSCNLSATDSLSARVERDDTSSKSFQKVQSDKNHQLLAAFLRWAEEQYGEFGYAYSQYVLIDADIHCRD
jgi:hypothetical protein